MIQAVVGIIDNDGPALALRADPTTMKEGYDPAGYLVLSHNSVLTEDLHVRLWVDAENMDEIVDALGGGSTPIEDVFAIAAKALAGSSAKN